MKIIKELSFILIGVILLYASCDSNNNNEDDFVETPTIEFVNDFFKSKTCIENTVTIQPVVVNWNGTQGTITLTDSLSDPNLQVNQQNGAISYTNNLYFGNHYITLKIESNDGSFVKTESFLLQKEISGTLVGKEGTTTQVENNEGQDITIEFTKDTNTDTRRANKYIDGDLNLWGTFSYKGNEVILELEGDEGRVRITGNAICSDNPYFDAKTFKYSSTNSSEPNNIPETNRYIRLYPQNN